jgi:peptidoglycan/LPS O-acetylase OafA/YrhL
VKINADRAAVIGGRWRQRGNSAIILKQRSFLSNRHIPRYLKVCRVPLSARLSSQNLPFTSINQAELQRDVMMRPNSPLCRQQSGGPKAITGRHPVDLTMKGRFVVLDGLRGLAAIAVAAYHAGIAVDLRGFLTVKASPAVDLFFCISGFVLAFAHDADIVDGNLTAAAFLLARWLRFLPIVILGSVLGLTAILFDPADYPIIYENVTNGFSFSCLLAILSLFLIPVALKSQLVFANNVFWSLCAELIVNLAYALQGNFLKQKYVYLIWLSSALLLASLFALFQSVQFVPETPLESFGSLVRAFASFFAGVAVFRLWQGGFRAPQVSPWLLMAIACLPFVFPYSATWFKVPFDAFFILLIYPAVVWFAASSSAVQFEAVLSTLGESSFALYAIHLPVLYFVKKPFLGQALGLRLMFVAGFVAMMVASSIMVATLFEKPARAAISRLRKQLVGKTFGSRSTSAKG